MSLYGLDVIVKDQKTLLEVNGVCSGMGGFEQVYGDQRVQEKVFEMWREKYRFLSVNTGKHIDQKFKKEHPLLWLWVKMSFSDWRRGRRTRKKLRALRKGETEWVDEKVKAKKVNFPFPEYVGQASTIINVFNGQTLFPTVNNPVGEDITRNKFLAYWFLKDKVPGVLDSTLVGLGSTHEKKLAEMLDRYDRFVLKPVLGSLGRGVKYLSKDEVAKRYVKSRGPVKDIKILDTFAKPALFYVEDLGLCGFSDFEMGLSLLQPFVEPAGEEYKVVRAIVCNGTFVDAYCKVSESPTVNFTRGARAEAFAWDEGFKDFCESVVKPLEENNLDFLTFGNEMYMEYFEQRGLTSEFQRRMDRTQLLFSLMSNAVKNYSRF